MKLFDLHCDTVTRCQKAQESFYKNSGHVDVFRGETLFDQWVQIMAVYVPDELEEVDAYSFTVQHLDFFDKQCSEYVMAENKKIRLIPALENGKGIGCDLSCISEFASRGLAYITLTWNGANKLGYGCLSRVDAGLTSFGKDAVREMQRVGIVPDVSHLNERGFWDVADVMRGAPFIASHSLAHAVCSHPRNLSDEQFLTIRDCGGIVGLHLCREHLGEQSLACFENHFYHFLSLGGENTLSIGLDLDGTAIPESWGGIAVADALYRYLLNRNYSQSLLNAVFFENSENFFREIFDNRKIMR